MTRPENQPPQPQFRIQKQNKGGKRPGFVFANPGAEASDRQGRRFGIVRDGDDGFRSTQLFQRLGKIAGVGIDVVTRACGCVVMALSNSLSEAYPLL